MVFDIEIVTSNNDGEGGGEAPKQMFDHILWWLF